MNFDLYNEEWIQRWKEHRTGWDLGGPHPKLADLLLRFQKLWEFSRKEIVRVAVPGCGSGHDAYFISQKINASLVDAFDVSNDAISIANSKHSLVAESNLNFYINDIFAKEQENQKALFTYDLIYDRAMLCALRPEQRKSYIEWIEKHTCSGAFVGALIFDTLESSSFHRPPFEITKAIFYMLFSAKKWDVICNESYPSVMENTVIKKERMYLLQRK